MSNPPPPDYDHPFEIQKRRRRWILLGIVVLVLVGFIAARTIYRRVKPDNLAAEARQHLGNAEYADASLLARRALDIDPYHVSATEVLADMAEKMNAPSALVWRKRLADLDEGNPDRQVELADAALIAQQPDLARLTLEKVPAAARETAPYHAAAAALAMASGDRESARLHIAAARRLKPDHPRYRFLEGVLQLSSTAPADRAARRRVFQESFAQSELRDDAMRALLRDAGETGDYSAALDAGASLAGEKDVPFATRLLYLEALEASKDEEAAAYRAALGREAQGDPMKFAALAGWLNGRQRAGETIELAAALDEKMQHAAPAGPALAAALSTVGEWPQLIALLEASKWEIFEPLRLAELAHAQRQTNDPEWSINWGTAVSQAGSQDALRQRLYEMAKRWEWHEEIPALLQTMTDSPTLGTWALRELYAHFRDQRDAGSLFRIVSQLYPRAPGDPRLQNNYAMLSLLLDREKTTATAIAKRQYDAAPLEPNVASTYAFALLKSNQSDSALRVMNRLDADQLAQPDVALYYGLVLSAAGKPELAGKYFERVDPALLLEPEARLMEAAKRAGKTP